MVAITYNFHSADNKPLPTLPIIDICMVVIFLIMSL